MTIKLTGIITVPADRLDQIRAGLVDHIRLTRAEPGCLSFDVVERNDGSGVFDVAEEFDDRASFDAHQTRAQNSDWARVSAGIPRDYQITESD